jgi:hypothetical protein
VIAPVSLVFQQGPSNVREIVQPWIDRSTTETASTALDSPNRAVDPIDAYRREVLIATADLFVLGLARTDSQVANRWRELTRLGQSIGFHQMVRPVLALADEFDRKRQAARWDPTPAARLAIDLAVLIRLAGDLGG